MSFRHAIFDLDGTLIDSLPGIAWSVEVALQERGFPPAAGDLRSRIGPPIREILAKLTGLREGRELDRLEGSFRGHYDSEGWRLTECQAGVPEILWDLLTGGAELWLVTNKPATATEQILRHLKLSGFFREAACRDSRRPPFGSKAELLRDLVRRHGLNRAECLMIGDTREDREAARAAGMRCAIVPHGYGDRPGGLSYCTGWEEVSEICTGVPV